MGAAVILSVVRRWEEEDYHAHVRAHPSIAAAKLDQIPIGPQYTERQLQSYARAATGDTIASLGTSARVEIEADSRVFGFELDEDLLELSGGLMRYWRRTQ